MSEGALATVDRFRRQYGPWAVVAGASEGLGAEFARQLAAHGLNLLLIARRRAVLDELAQTLRDQAGVEIRCLPLDLGASDLAAQIEEATHDLEVGLLVYNAARSHIGVFFDTPLADHLAVVDVNCRGPVTLVHALAGRMRRRGRGGVLLMASMAGFQGTALLTSYAATKAFTRVLGEGLWDELRRSGVDVLVCNAGATRTPNYLATKPRQGGMTGKLMEPTAVVRGALGSLGKRFQVTPGWSNRLAAIVMQRLVPRRLAVLIMGRATRSLYGR